MQFCKKSKLWVHLHKPVETLKVIVHQVSIRVSEDQRPESVGLAVVLDVGCTGGLGMEGEGKPGL